MARGITAQKKRRIKELREKGLTIAEVAQRTGVSAATVVRYTAADGSSEPRAAAPAASAPSVGGVEKRLAEVERAVDALRADLAQIANGGAPPEAGRLDAVENQVRVLSYDLGRLKTKKPRLFR